MHCDLSHDLTAALFLSLLHSLPPCSAAAGQTKAAVDVVAALCRSGYAPTDIIQTLFRVTRSADLPEPQKLEMLREIGLSHMRIAEVGAAEGGEGGTAGGSCLSSGRHNFLSVLCNGCAALRGIVLCNI